MTNTIKFPPQARAPITLSAPANLNAPPRPDPVGGRMIRRASGFGLWCAGLTAMGTVLANAASSFPLP